jgi:hypothetical protein
MKIGLLFISACLVLVGALSAGTPEIQVVPASEDLLESHPRKIVTSVFFVTNWADKEMELKPRVDLPAGWHLVASDRRIHVAPGQREMSLVSFLIPGTARAGSYKVGYAIRPGDGRAPMDSSAIRVNVIPLTKLHLEILDYPRFVVAGETYNVTVALINQGNTAADVDISVASHTGFPIGSALHPLGLSPGESATFRISVATDPGIRKILQERLAITARASSDPNTRDQAWCYLEILPRITGMKGRYNSVPAMASVSYVNQENAPDRSRIQGALRGSGSLDQEGDRHVDFVLQGPDLGQNRLLGSRDEYFLNCRFGNKSVILGDYSYSVSPLTENHRYGRGGKASAVVKSLRFGGYHMETRWADPNEEQTAGYLDYLLGDDSLVGIRYLKRVSEQSGEMLSVESRLHPATDTDLEMEYARALAEDDGNSAYSLKFDSLRPWGSYLLRFIRAGADYTGFYRDMDFISTSLGLNFSRDFRFDASFRQERHNLSLDPTSYSAPLERDHRLRLLFRSGASMDYSLAYREHESKDRFAQATFDFRERSVRAALGQRYDHWDCSAAAEIGKTYDRLNQHTRMLERYTATLRIMPTDRQSYHGYFYYDRSGGPDEHAIRHLSAGITASVTLGSSTTLDAGFRSNLFEDIENQDRDVLELTLKQRLFHQTELVLRGHYTGYRYTEGPGHLAFMIEYNIPFGMPVSRRDEVGSLKGKVYDQETGQPLQDVILKLDGATAVTDAAGKFSFPTIPVGMHHLSVDRSSIGIDRIPWRRFPMEITIQGGETISTEIPVVRGASITGRIELYSYQDSTSGVLTPESQRRLVKRGGLPNILIELADGDETKHILTARDGTFRAEELRPGRWTLTIAPEHLPEHCMVDNADLRFTLEPGGTATALVRVIPKARPLRILEEGGTLTEQVRP